jgi:hypothetical protein
MLKKYKGWELGYTVWCGSTKVAAFRFGVRMCANTIEELKNMIDLRPVFGNNYVLDLSNEPLKVNV